MASIALDRLVSLKALNLKNPQAVNKDLYRLLLKEDLLIVSYNSIKSKPGNMTPGSDNITLDGFSGKIVQDIISELRNQSYQFKPVKRIYIPKGNTGKMRPLGVPSPRDKVVQTAMLMILESIYDPIFSTLSHGFRSGRSSHTALRQVRLEWSGVKWVIEGDIKGFYDNVNHYTLMKILRRKIQDERFLNLIWKMLRAGIEIDGKVLNSKLGTPQGGIISPILSNIYLHELDVFVSSLIKEVGNNSNRSRRENPEYKSTRGKIYRLQTKRSNKGIIHLKPTDEDQCIINVLKKHLLQIPSKDPFDPNYRKITYVRYADDWIIGTIGDKTFTNKILELVKNFLKELLSLDLSEEKTKVTLLSSGNINFLGYKIKSGGKSEFSTTKTGQKRRTVGWQPRLMAPTEELVKTLALNNFCTTDGRGVRKKGWINYPDDIIVGRFNSIIRGYRNYYSPADNYGTTMNRLEFILKLSCAHTLASKHRTRISVQLTRLKTLGLDVSDRYRNNIWDFKIGASLDDLNLLFKFYVKRTRLLSDTKCLICESTEDLEMHHVRALRKDGVPLKDNYMIGVMQRMNRKQITVCRSCHMDIHQAKYDGNSISMLDSRSRKQVIGETNE